MLLTVIFMGSGISLNAAEIAYKTIDFGASTTTKESVSSYTSTWKATSGDDTWSIANFNNNKNSWTKYKMWQEE